MIETNQLTRKFENVLAVDRLTIAVRAGEVFGFLGPNGAGKTTTIRMLAALIAPSAGSAQVAGYRLGEQDTVIRGKIGILTETPGLYDRLSAERNLAFFAHLYRVADVAGQVERYLKLMGLWNRRQDAAGTLSKGMRQKLAIARALLHEPEVLLLDEPTSGLDPRAAHMVREFIESLKRAGRTIFICTHNLDEADRLCDRVAVFNSRLLAVDTPKSLRRRLFGRTVVFHLAEVRESYRLVLSEESFVQEVRIVDNKLVVIVEDPEQQNPLLVRRLVDAGAEIRFVGEVRRSLEDVYLRLIEEKDERED